MKELNVELKLNNDEFNRKIKEELRSKDNKKIKFEFNLNNEVFNEKMKDGR